MIVKLYKNLINSLNGLKIVVGEKSDRAKAFANMYVQSAMKVNVNVLFTGSREAEAIKLFSSHFHRVVIVTNQQGISKRLMTEDDLHKVHQHLLQEVQNFGGRIDAIYHAPQLAEENSIMRKPNIGMALQAKEEFPSIDFKKSIMVGDSISDIEFAKNANMFGVLIGQSEKYFSIDSLISLSKLF